MDENTKDKYIEAMNIVSDLISEIDLRGDVGFNKIESLYRLDSIISDLMYTDQRVQN